MSTVDAPVSRPRFFFWISLLLLGINLVGFASTFYLRPLFDVQPRPAYLMWHGAILTLWFVLLIAQTSLVAAGRVHLHRMLGGVGAALVPLIVLGGLLAQLRQPARLAAMGIDIDRLHGLFWVNISALSMFAAFVWIAVYMRRNADSHKRLMILAAIDLMGPALGRMARWPAFGGIALETPHANEPRFIILCSLALLLTLVVYDLVVKRRLLATTWIGGLSLILSRVLAILVSQTAFGRSVIPALL